MKNPQRLIRELYSSTHNPETDDRKTRFAGLNQFVTARHGWLTSIPGESEVTMETLEGSSLPDELKRLGYDVRETGEGSASCLMRSSSTSSPVRMASSNRWSKDQASRSRRP
jgi:hypothetical protein